MSEAEVALVTGGSRGLGATISRVLAEAGWIVVVNYANNRQVAEGLVNEIGAAGGKAIVARFNVLDDDEIARGLKEIADSIGPVDLLVNNAAGHQPFIAIEDQTWRDHLNQLEYFVKAPLALLQALLPDWRRRKTGRVINIGSECFYIGNEKFAHYVGAKGAMHGLTRSWARELAPEGITVNTVEPGWVSVQEQRKATTTKEDLEEYRRQVPLGHIGSPRDVANLVVFLASRQASFITGQAIAVNGGRTLS